MNERAELKLFSDDEVKIIAYEWDGLKLVMVETTYDSSWVSSCYSDSPPDDGWWCEDENGNFICATCGRVLSDATQIAKAWIPIDDEEEI